MSKTAELRAMSTKPSERRWITIRILHPSSTQPGSLSSSPARNSASRHDPTPIVRSGRVTTTAAHPDLILLQLVPNRQRQAASRRPFRASTKTSFRWAFRISIIQSSVHASASPDDFGPHYVDTPNYL